MYVTTRGNIRVLVYNKKYGDIDVYFTVVVKCKIN